MIDESDRGDNEGTSSLTFGAASGSSEAEVDDAQLSPWALDRIPSATFALTSDAPDQAEFHKRRKIFPSGRAAKTAAPLDSQDGDLPALDGNGPSRDTVVAPNDFPQHPHQRFRSRNHSADWRKPQRPTGLAIDVPGRGLRGPYATNPGTIDPGTTNQPFAGMKHRKYPIVRWQAPGNSNATGRPVLIGTGPRGGTTASGLGRSPSISGGGKTHTGRSKFKPVVVAPHLMPQPGNTRLR